MRAARNGLHLHGRHRSSNKRGNLKRERHPAQDMIARAMAAIVGLAGLVTDAGVVVHPADLPVRPEARRRAGPGACWVWGGVADCDPRKHSPRRLTVTERGSTETPGASA